MPTQTRYFQHDVLRAAQRAGTLGDLRWFVEAEFPKRMLRPGVKRCQPAQWPHGCTPVIPAAPDPDAARAWAELLAELFNLDNRGRGIVFAPALTSVDLLAGMAWYEYGGELPPIEVDHICGTCGQVIRAKIGEPPRCECYAW